MANKYQVLKFVGEGNMKDMKLITYQRGPNYCRASQSIWSLNI